MPIGVVDFWIKMSSILDHVNKPQVLSTNQVPDLNPTNVQQGEEQKGMQRVVEQKAGIAKDKQTSIAVRSGGVDIPSLKKNLMAIVVLTVMFVVFILFVSYLKSRT